MEKFQLSNAMNVVYAGYSAEYSVCLAVHVGHINEPKKGIAALFEKVLLLQVKGIIPVFGGTMTVFTAGNEDLEEALSTVAQIFNQSLITDEMVALAKEAIFKQTQEATALVMRQMKLLYKHTAFGAARMMMPDDYLAVVHSYSADDVRYFMQTYYTAANIDLVISGPRIPLADLKDAVGLYFKQLPQGVAQPRFVGNIYTGGFTRMAVAGNTLTRLMFGWDVSRLTLDDSAVMNVMMSMFWKQVEQAFAKAGIDAQVEFRIAGYYGARTVRLLAAADYDAQIMADIIMAEVNHICDIPASDELMVQSRNMAVNEKLDKYEKSDDAALEKIWQMNGRSVSSDTSSRIEEIKDVDADAVQVLAQRVFRGSKPAVVLIADVEMPFYSLSDICEKLKTQI